MAYNLDKRTQPNAVALANYFGPKHGIKAVGGWRSVGSVPNSDHPKGLAIDFMTRDKAQGDALAADLIANASAWGITYVIWWRRIWRPGVGWKPYTGPVPHTDHVHASVAANGTTGNTSGVSVTPVDNPLIPDSIEKAASFIGDPAVWRKAFLYFVGALLVVVGFILLVGLQGQIKTAVKTAVKVKGMKK